MRQRCPEELVKARYALAIGRRVANHEEPIDARRVPTPRARDLPRESDLPIEWREGSLCIGDDGLDLGDEEGAGRRVEAQYIDRAAIAVDVERHLERDLPSSRAQQGHDGVHQRGMTLVKESIKTLAVPTNADVEVSAQRTAHGLDLRQVNGPRPTALDLRNE